VVTPDSLRRCGRRREKEDQDQEGQQEPQPPASGGAECQHRLVPIGDALWSIFPENVTWRENMLLLLPRWRW